jgi:hypothetical protein
VEKTVKFSPVVAAIASADKAESTAFAACRTAAQTIFERVNKDAPAKEEHARLMSEAFALAAKEGLVINNRNTRQHIGQHLLICFDSDAMIEVAKTKTETVAKPAAQCKTAREVAAAAKQIRENLGMSDGRKGNAPRQSVKPVSTTPSLWALVEAALREKANREKLFAVIRAAGYEIAPAKAEKMPAPKVTRSKPKATQTKPVELPAATI